MFYKRFWICLEGDGLSILKCKPIAKIECLKLTIFLNHFQPSKEGENEKTTKSNITDKLDATK